MSSAAPTPRRIAVEGPLSDEEVDLFGAYTALVPITVLGEAFHVPEHNTLLRALQFVELRTGRVRLDWGRYCWNDSKGCCALAVRTAEGEREVRACRFPVTDALEVVRLPAGGRRC